jgi:ABC-type transport system involved in cytochrome c biogenesis permease subunit
MIWDYFIWFAAVSALLWITGSVLAWRDRRSPALVSYIAGTLVFFSFMIAMWVALERPPMRTMGETRLWYSFFMAVAGIIVYSRWKYKWILSFSTIMALVYITVNLLKPQIHTKSLMPALQSPWFAPHVIVYMFSYGMLGAATIMALYVLIFKKDDVTARETSTTDNLVATGLAFLTFGMLFGALWAQEVWGTYWAWDPKETWAAITWLTYLLYVHYTISRPKDHQTAMWILILAFICLQICWWGINYLPSAHATSVHVY